MTDSLAGDGLTIPLLLALGCPPALATVIGVLPVAGSVAQLGVPWLLRRANGEPPARDAGDPRGRRAARVRPRRGDAPRGRRRHRGCCRDRAIAVVMGIAGAAGTIGGTNLQAWYGAVLAERDRRLRRAEGRRREPRASARSCCSPSHSSSRPRSPRVGIAVYAGVFVLSGIAGDRRAARRPTPAPPGSRPHPRGAAAPAAPPRSVGPPVAGAWAETTSAGTPTGTPASHRHRRRAAGPPFSPPCRASSGSSRSPPSARASGRTSRSTR